MNKIIVTLLCLVTAYTSLTYDGGTLAPTIIAGAIVKSSGTEINKKYPRRSCPVCKGTGKYLSGDGIKMVDCGYCEPEKSEPPQAASDTKCSNPNCKCKQCKCKNCGCVPSVEK
jgi:hypothetical protein